MNLSEVKNLNLNSEDRCEFNEVKGTHRLMKIIPANN